MGKLSETTFEMVFMLVLAGLSILLWVDIHSFSATSRLNSEVVKQREFLGTINQRIDDLKSTNHTIVVNPN